jgi:hypothetical protein
VFLLVVAWLSMPLAVAGEIQIQSKYLTNSGVQFQLKRWAWRIGQYAWPRTGASPWSLESPASQVHSFVVAVCFLTIIVDNDHGMGNIMLKYSLQYCF